MKEDEPYSTHEIGNFNKRNRLSFSPVHFEHEQPIQVTKNIVQNSPDVQQELIESLEADYLIKT